MNSPLHTLITLGLRNLTDHPATGRAEVLEVAAELLKAEDPKLSEKAAVTAATIRAAESLQGELFASLNH
jgi:hypothetical protein